MINTLVRFPEEEYELYKQIAESEDISLAEYIRRAAREKINKKMKNGKSIWDLGVKVKFLGKIQGGSQTVDKDLYMLNANK